MKCHSLVSRPIRLNAARAGRLYFIVGYLIPRATALIAENRTPFVFTRNFRTGANMLRNRFLTLVLGLLTINLIFAAQVGAQTTINFTEFPVFTKAGEKYVNKGVLFSSRDGSPMITKDNVITGKIGLCAEGRRTIDAGISEFQANFCEDVYVGFVSPEQKMVSNFAQNINIKFLAVGAVTAFWIDEEGVVQNVQASLSDGNELAVSIPGKTEGVFLVSTDSDCAICNFMITSVSFVLSKNTDPICDQPITDAGYSFRRLINEDYPQEIYQRLEEFRKPNQGLGIRLQYLKPGQKTYYDEFAIIVKLPEGERDFAQDIFTDMRRKLDTVGLGKPASDFTNIGEFTYFEPNKVANRANRLPTVGDIFQVDIWGPDNGDVMMTELKESPGRSRFRYSTLTNNLPKGSGSHPNNGSREYGYSKTLDGWTKFYVRGIDQYRTPRLPGAETIGIVKQNEFWLSFLEGIGNRVKFYNGGVIFPAEKTIDKTLMGLPKCHMPPQKGYGN